MAGPLLLVAVLAVHTGDYRLAFGVLAVPGVLVLLVLAWLRLRVPDPLAYEAPVTPTAREDPGDGLRATLPSLMWQYVAAMRRLSRPG